MVMACLAFTHASAQIAAYNFDFENWYKDSAGEDRLDIWEHIDRNGNIRQQLHGTVKSAQSYSGSYAVTLHRWYMVDSDDLKMKNAISQKPRYLNGFYKYTDVVLSSHPDTAFDDTATVTLYFTKWNHISGEEDTIGYGYSKLSVTSGYIPFSCPITYVNAVQPDSFYIYIRPSKYTFGVGCKDNPDCSFLTIDNLSFSNTTSSGNILQEKTTLKIYPNPANEWILLEGASGTLTVRIYNASGICQTKQEAKEGKVNVEHLPPGLYRIVGQDGDKLWNGTFVKQ